PELFGSISPPRSGISTLRSHRARQQRQGHRHLGDVRFLIPCRIVFLDNEVRTAKLTGGAEQGIAGEYFVHSLPSHDRSQPGVAANLEGIGGGIQPVTLAVAVLTCSILSRGRGNKSGRDAGSVLYSSLAKARIREAVEG